MTAPKEANIKTKLSDYSRAISALDQKQYKTCTDNDMSLGLVFRDMNLASSNVIESTPTIYVNGRRLQGIKDVSELRELISEAKAEAVGERQKETGLGVAGNSK